MRTWRFNREWWDGLTPRMKKTVFFGSIFVIFILPALFFSVKKSIYSATITLTYAPKSSDVKIGSTQGVFGDNDVQPGTYKVVISKKGFDTYTEEVTVTYGQKVSVEAALVSNDPSTANWYQTHTEDYTIAQGITDRKADKQYANMIETFPIAKDLPIVGLYSAYRVDYGVSPTEQGKLAVYITSQTEAYKQQAIAAVQAKGYDLANYEVVYKQSEPTMYGTTGVTGLAALSEKGLSSDAVDVITRALAEHFATYQNEEITSIAITSEPTHAISDDRSVDTYASSLTLNGKYEQRLVVTLRDYNHLVIQVSSPSGSDPSTIFDGLTN